MAFKVDEEIRTALKTIIDHFDQEDRAVRDRQIREWKRLKLYWNGFQRVWYSEVAHDWRIYDDQNNDEDQNNSHYDKPVNVFRAYLESIIAALSVLIPPVRCKPDDAENPLDGSTAKAGNFIAELVDKQNDVKLLWLHALYIYMTEGLIACYNYTDTDEKYGTYETTETKDEEVTGRFCPKCAEQLQGDEFLSNEGSTDITCPECQEEISFPDEETRTIPRITKKTTHPKSRQKMECYGGLYVKIPNYAMTQEQCPYLGFSREVHYTVAINEYEELRSLKNDWQTKVGYDSGGVYDPYERWGRLSPQYQGEYPINTVTIRKFWLRPCSYNILTDELQDKVEKKFPKGVCVVLANEEIATDPIEELLDDHWTLTKNPLSDYLHHDPLGLLLTSIQDITNELISLVIQTIEHGIPQTFADPAVLNFNDYRQTEVTPGQIFPAKARSGKSIGDGFYEVRTATLSREVLPFAQKIQEYGQLVSGALPSLFGGASKAGSQTAAEYSMSRSSALQRLNTPWKMLSVWWKTIHEKVIIAYIDTVHEDERHVVKDKNSPGGFINVLINKSDIQGTIGDIECEADENLPASWTQVKDVILELMTSNNPVMMAAMMSPENLPFVSEAIGLNQFKIPGESDRNKQYEEIKLLLESEPIPSEEIDPNTGEPMEGPSILIDPDVDNNQVQELICKAWAVSDAGQLAKLENPKGYKNVVLHLKMHQAIGQQQAIELAQTGGAPPNEGVR